MNNIGYEQAADFLKRNDNFYILIHVSPDGDAMGSGFGLCAALRGIGKNANVLCSDPFPTKYDYMTEWYAPQRFSPKTIVSTDLADTKLFGKELSAYRDYVDLCIDHHISNTGYAKRNVIDPNASAACQVLYEILKQGDFPIDRRTALCLYTGLATDTGCFKFENTTPRCHIIAAELMDYDLGVGKINRQLFDIKSRARLMVEQQAIETMETYLDDKCAMIAVTYDMISESGLSSEDMEGLAALPMQIRGVELGITFKEKEPGRFKISMRSSDNVNASDICAALGGGGHARAAGCSAEGDLQQVKMKVLSAAASVMGFDLWLS